ncbi:MAG: APC family permease [Gemmatimonadales bacterium]|nr:APC family permease [Gemmatimonadales bacterium]MDZ4388661.1 APC family permease [Gemmatimonadales bacterium]
MLGTAFGVAVLVGNTIVVGILRTTGEVAGHLPSTALFLGVWVVGGLYAVLGAMSLAEPGAMIRRSGGQYPIVHRALGPYPGFVVGWSDWLSTAASLALVAIVFAEYSAPLLPAFPAQAPIISALLVIGFGLLQWRGVKSGDIAQQLLSALKAIAFGALIVAALVMVVPDRVTPIDVALPVGTGLIAAIILGLQSVIYTYDGWTGPIYFGEETVDGGRAIPRAMIGGVLVVLVIYLCYNVAMVRVLGVEAMAGDPFVAATASTVLFGAKGDLVLRLLVLLSILGGVNALLLLASRVPLAMSRDGLMPARLDSVNAGGTPTVAHWTSVGLTLGFILSGTFNTVLAIAAFFFVANYVLSFWSVFALRRNEPDTPRPFRVPGFPWTTGLVLLGSVAFIVGSIVSDRTNSLRSIVLLAASYPVYRLVLRLRGK